MRVEQSISLHEDSIFGFESSVAELYFLVRDQILQMLFLRRVGALLVLRISLALLDTEPGLCGWCCPLVVAVLGRSESRIFKKCHYLSSISGGSHVGGECMDRTSKPASC